MCSVRLSVWSSSILDTLLSESTSWFRQNSDSSDFYLLGTFDPNLFIFCFLSSFPQPFRNRYLCFCFAKKPRETFLYKIDVLGLMGLIVDSFDVCWESGWLRKYRKWSWHFRAKKNLLLEHLWCLVTVKIEYLDITYAYEKA